MSELCQINNKSGPLVILSGFGLTCISAPASRQRVHSLFSHSLTLGRCTLRGSNVQPVPWRPTRQLHNN